MAKKGKGLGFDSIQDTVKSQNKQVKKNLKQQEKFNRFDQVNPFGSQKWVIGPNGKRRLETTLNKDQDALLQGDIGRDKAIDEISSGYLNAIKGMGFDPTNFDYSAQRKAIEDQLYNQFESVNAPKFAQEKAAMEQSLYDKGVVPGSPQWNKELTQMMERQHGASNEARSLAMQFGGQEQDRAFDQTMGARRQAYDELTNLLSNRKGPVMPNFAPPAQINVPHTDPLGATSLFKNIEANKWAVNAGFGHDKEMFGLGQQAWQDQWNAINNFNGGGGGGSSPWGAAGSAAAQGLGSGLGNAWGKSKF